MLVFTQMKLQGHYLAFMCKLRKIYFIAKYSFNWKEKKNVFTSGYNLPVMDLMIMLFRVEIDILNLHLLPISKKGALCILRVFYANFTDSSKFLFIYYLSWYFFYHYPQQVFLEVLSMFLHSPTLMYSFCGQATIFFFFNIKKK